jgi:prephenate dehydratase
MTEKIISAPNIIKTALEYSELAALLELSEGQADRMEYILIEASNDPILNFWINEIDHCLGHQLGLTNGEIEVQYATQQSLLQEHLETFLEALDASLEVGKFQSEAEARRLLKRPKQPAASFSNEVILTAAEK